MKINHVRYGDLILFEEKSFKNEFDLNGIAEDDLTECSLEHIFEKLKSQLPSFRRAGLITNINNDNFRTPNVKLVYPFSNETIDPWVMTIDNGIKYTFNCTKSMFCKGNINEKLRLSKLDCSKEVVVDLFAGIGYFSLIFAVHCNARHVYCCEWNPDAVEALRRNIQLNGVQHKMTICPVGDNRQTCPSNIAHRVNMGLIPSSLGSLQIACRSLRTDTNQPLTLHIHENLSYYNQILKNDNHEISKKSLINQERYKWAKSIADQVHQQMILLHPQFFWNVNVNSINRIKRYAPHIDHMVVDICCTNQSIIKSDP